MKTKLLSALLTFALGVGLSALRTEWPAVDFQPPYEIQDGTLWTEDYHILGNGLCVITGGEGDRTAELQVAIQNCDTITLKRGAGEFGDVVSVGSITIPPNITLDASDGTRIGIGSGQTLVFEGTIIPGPPPSITIQGEDHSTLIGPGHQNYDAMPSK